LRPLAALLAVVSLVGCVKKGGDAVVVGKEYKPPVEIVEAPTPDAAEPTPGAANSPRMSDEQWIVSVRMVSDNRWIDVPVLKSQFEKLKEGDQVKVVFREGKYTGTVWAAEIR
jgi:hypothetical protein